RDEQPRLDPDGPWLRTGPLVRLDGPGGRRPHRDHAAPLLPRPGDRPGGFRAHRAPLRVHRVLLHELRLHRLEPPPSHLPPPPPARRPPPPPTPASRPAVKCSPAVGAATAPSSLAYTVWYRSRSSPSEFPTSPRCFRAARMYGGSGVSPTRSSTSPVLAAPRT